MMQQPWFKVFIWFIATAFFLLASNLIISYLSPEPTEAQVMRFMMGMMGAMHNSLMGLSMSLESDPILSRLTVTVSYITVPLVTLSIVFGLIFRKLSGYQK